MPKIKLAYPVRELTGKFSGSDVVYYTAKNGGTIARAANGITNPRTPGQTSSRAFLAAASKAWSTITQAQRDDWTEYSANYFTRTRKGEPLPPNGMAAFVKANTIRQVLGLSIVASAPTEAPPPPLSSAVLGGASMPEDLPLQIAHSITDLTGLQVIVQMTRAMATTARKPTTNELRLCCGVGPNSAQPLAASGTILMFENTIYSIQDGERFGTEARVVRTADGIMSIPVYDDTLKVV